ncbi:hypothetical protein EJB05_48478, partial [Eragrostis curvula]
MGCVSSKILTKSGSFQEKVSHTFQRSSNNVIEEIILSSSKSNGDQFLALLCTSTSSARKAVKEPEQSAAVTAAAEPPAAKIETINVSELLAGLEEESFAAEKEQEQEQRSDGDRKEGGRSPAQCAASDGGAAARAWSFRTVEEFDALVTQSGSSERAPAPAPEQEEPGTATPTAATSSGATAERSSSSGQEEELAAKGEDGAGSKRRARARQLGELKVPTTFDFSKSGSLRDWLLRGGQIFSPGSYVTPRFGTAPAVPAAERGGDENTGEKQQQQKQNAVFDPELVAQFERAMEQLSEDEERVLTEILEALELGTGETDAAAALGKVSDRPVAMAVRQD